MQELAERSSAKLDRLETEVTCWSVTVLTVIVGGQFLFYAGTVDSSSVPFIGIGLALGGLSGICLGRYLVGYLCGRLSAAHYPDLLKHFTSNLFQRGLMLGVLDPAPQPALAAVLGLDARSEQHEEPVLVTPRPSAEPTNKSLAPRLKRMLERYPGCCQALRLRALPPRFDADCEATALALQAALIISLLLSPIYFLSHGNIVPTFELSTFLIISWCCGVVSIVARWRILHALSTAALSSAMTQELDLPLEGN